MIAARRVVLPAPLGPITVTMLPSSTDSDTPCRASTLPYATCRSQTSSSALIGVPRLLHAPEVGLDHQRVALDLCRQAFRQFLAKVHHDQPVSQPHDEVHVVLD